MNIRTSLTAIALIAVCAFPVVVMAQEVPIEGTVITFDDVVTLVEDAMWALITVASLAVVAMIIYAGFKMAISRGDEKEYGAAKNILKYAIYGAFIVFGVGLIVNTIASIALDPRDVLN